jgi:hypothetical protein
MLSLCRKAVLTKCKIDPAWAMIPQPIRPDVFAGPDSDWDNAYNRGVKKLEHRYIAALFIALPHLIARFGGPKEFQGYNVTVQNMSYLAMDFMGWEGDSESTVKSRIWGPSRPVVHAAAACILEALASREVKEAMEAIEDPGVFSLFLTCPLTLFLTYPLTYPETLEGIVTRSEGIRLGLAVVPQFRVKEEETIQFLPE